MNKQGHAWGGGVDCLQIVGCRHTCGSALEVGVYWPRFVVNFTCLDCQVVIAEHNDPPNWKRYMAAITEVVEA